MNRLFMLLLLFVSISSNAVLYDIYAKYGVKRGHQLQDIAWYGQMYSFFEPESLCEESHPQIAYIRPVSPTSTGLDFHDGKCSPPNTKMNAHQGYDIHNNQVFFHLRMPVDPKADVLDRTNISRARDARTIAHYEFDSTNFTVIPSTETIVTLAMSGDKGDETDGAWGSKGMATDGEYIVTAAYPGSEWDNIYVHIYQYNEVMNGNPNFYKMFRVAAPSGGVQGVEVVNNKVYLSFGGLEHYGDQESTQVHQYTLDGMQTGKVTLDPKGVMAITKDEYNFPESLSIEHEGLTVKDGIVYAGLYYKYGITEKNKHLIYEAFDSSKTTGDGWSYLRNQQSGLCLNPWGVDGSAGSNITLHPCVGSEDQIWDLPSVGTWGVIKNHVQNLCLNPDGTSGSSGSNVNLAICASNYDDQLWMPLTDGRIVNKAQGYCLNPYGTAGSEDANVDIATCSNTHADQKWDKTISTNQVIWNEANPNVGLETNGWAKISNRASSGTTCLDASGYSGDAGKNVYMNNCDGLPDQMWELPAVGTWGYIKNVMNGACLNPYGTSGGKNANVNLGNCVAGYNDLLWMVHPDGRILNRVRSYCLNPKGTTGSSGSDVNLYPCDSRYQDHYWYSLNVQN